MDARAQHPRARAALLVTASAALAATTLFAVLRAAEPCGGVLREVTYLPPPGGITSLPMVGKLQRAHADARASAASLGPFDLDLGVSAQQGQELWWTREIRDPAFCPESGVPVHLPEMSAGPPELTLYRDGAAYVVVYDNTRNRRMVPRFDPQRERGEYHEVIAAAFEREARPIRFYPTRARLGQLGAIALGAAGLILGWLLHRRAAPRR